MLRAIPAAPPNPHQPSHKDTQGRESTGSAECPVQVVPWLALSPSTELVDGLGAGHGIAVGVVHLDPIVANAHGIRGHHPWGQKEHTHTAGCLVSCTSKLLSGFYLGLAAFLKISSL